MAMTETENKAIEETKKSEYKYRITPRYGVWSDEDKIIIQAAIPGVKKENIEMKTLTDYFTLRAKRDDILYSLDLEMGVEIEPEKTKATYEEGLLRVELKRYKPLEHAYEVKIE
ncbi:MAG: hypothetical protein DRO88_12125 [Promethearchaeia archaeon]|nr:MAG: hypothetical protein DRO88_12125 [Candidatus Lokiarchaeia archaeon]